MNDRDLARGLAAGRAGVGVALMLAPSAAARGWLGPSSSLGPVKVLIRAFGARDLALGLGLLRALESGDPVRPWLRAGAGADAVDALATLAAFRQLPKLGRLGILAVAAGAAVTGLRLADALD